MTSWASTEAGSRWWLQRFDELGARLRGIERWFHNDPEADLEAARTATVAAIRDRYASTTRMQR